MHCCIIPKDVLERFANDTKLSREIRSALSDTARITEALRRARVEVGKATNVGQLSGVSLAAIELAPAPQVTVYDCKHTSSLPGVPVPAPKSSKDKTGKRAFDETTSVAKFYNDVFNRNSIDNA